MNAPIRWILTPLLAALALAALALAAQAAPASLPGADQIVARTLPNGLKIVVWPDHDIPNVAMYTWYRAGSRNERPGITGLSHYFEHMMFNGTSTRPPGDFDRVMEAHGGSNNAYTSSDVTVYQNWFPVSATELIFDLESDRMRNLDFDPQVVESERGVVSSERRARIDNDNFGTLVEQVQATAFIAHPYERSAGRAARRTAVPRPRPRRCRRVRHACRGGGRPCGARGDRPVLPAVQGSSGRADRRCRAHSRRSPQARAGDRDEDYRSSLRSVVSTA